MTVVIPSRLELLPVIDRVAQTLCEGMEFGEDACSQVTMSVIEAGTNAIQHGHRRDAAKDVDVTFRTFPDRIEIDVHDIGPGFDLSEVNGDITRPEHLLETRGRGIYIMRACMDTVDFRFGPSGTICHLVKRRPAVANSA
ncbi:MAG: hypothetical protein A2W00_00400 [Candidatus Eisenbacteria bacterium RBG_16_71_46]|nr:MAG: hypothetical protein A2W00_00400 [Candidatus Eisenbacteria bacterium RBG_16_71_46]OGF24037.1 MAG: hypothetical protein A2V63_01145 [Candidatus Eisenbacteria bacterium RBG_19FT_COMBO_70_11]